MGRHTIKILKLGTRNSKFKIRKHASILQIGRHTIKALKLGDTRYKIWNGEARISTFTMGRHTHTQAMV